MKLFLSVAPIATLIVNESIHNEEVSKRFEIFLQTPYEPVSPLRSNSFTLNVIAYEQANIVHKNFTLDSLSYLTINHK